MTNRFRWWCVIAIVGIPIFLTSTASAQTPFDTRWNVPEGMWSEDANWVFEDGSEAEPPSIQFDESAWIGNGGTAIVDSAVPDIVKLQIPNGTVVIQQGGSLKAVDTSNQDVSGPSVIRGNGTLRFTGNGSLSTVDLDNNGVIELNSLNSNFNVTGDFNHRGTLALNITSAGTPKVTVGGAATLNGTIAPNFDNSINLAFGDSFQFLSGASSVANNGARVVVPDSVVLDVGLDIQVTNTSSTASLVVSNLPVLSVDRATGAANIRNVVGGPVTMTGYTIGSELGLLNPGGLAGLKSQGAAGWEAPNPMPTVMSEINLTGEASLAVDDSISLGNAYNGGATHPNDEDVTFQFSTPDGRILDGLVEYTGPANDLVANVNPATGEITLYHLSAHLDPIEVTGYSILSASGALNAEAWNSFVDSGEAGAGWVEANPQATVISELNLEASKVFDNGTVISLGNIFKTDGLRDIQLDYTTSDALLTATIEYGEVPVVAGCAPVNALLGDLDGSGNVGFPDFLILSANFGQDVSTYAEGDVDCNGNVAFPDFLTLSANFGKTLGATAASVPEPSGIFLLGLGGVFVLRRRPKSTAT